MRPVGEFYVPTSVALMPWASERAAPSYSLGRQPAPRWPQGGRVCNKVSFTQSDALNRPRGTRCFTSSASPCPCPPLKLGRPLLLSSRRCTARVIHASEHPRTLSRASRGCSCPPSVRLGRWTANGRVSRPSVRDASLWLRPLEGRRNAAVSSGKGKVTSRRI